MKFIYCPLKGCKDIFGLRYESRTCACGKSGGRYEKDGLHAVIWGAAIPVGFSNQSFFSALRQQPEHGPGACFDAFVIEKNCPTVRVADAPE